jgi:hypothetical protein
MESVRYADTIRLLLAAEVEFIVVGMAAGIIQGAPTVTFDLDIVHHRTPDNVGRLLTVLEQVHAIARYDERKIKPGPSHLLGPGHVLLTTDYGDFDCLGEIDQQLSFDDLLPRSVEVDFEGMRVRVLELATLIEFKRRAGRPKDMAVLHLLQATLDEVRRLPAK